MVAKLIRPSVEDDAAIARGIASDKTRRRHVGAVPGIVRRRGRPTKANPKVSVRLRLDRDVIDRFKATGQGWQTRINAVLKKSKVG